MSTNVIKQTLVGEPGMQTIKQIVRSNERGPQGVPGPQGIQGVPGPVGPRGADGSVHYEPGIGINITPNNIIEATGEATAVWGGVQGDIADQTDLQEEFDEYTKTENLAAVALSNSYNDLDNQPTIPTVNNGTLTIYQNGTSIATFTANSSANASALITSPVITMTTTDPGEGSSLAANNYVAVYGDEPIILDYSTTEVDTGTKWINGESIYRKTVNIGSLPNATSKTVAHNISNFGTLVKLEGSFTNGTISSPLPYPSATSTRVVEVWVDATDITVGSAMDRSAFTGYVTLYYTKSA